MSSTNKSQSKLSNRRLVENEVIFKDVNTNIKEFIKEETSGTAATILPFYCECSDPECIERIKLSTTDYEKLHKSRKHYITVVGHEFPEVERVVNKESHYQVVEKYFTPPKPQDIDMALKAINAV